MKDNKNRQIIETLHNKNQDEFERLNVSGKENNYEKNKKLDSEILEYINNVEKEINYIFSEEYKKYLLKSQSLKPEKNILKLSNGMEKLVRYFYSMNPSSKTYILKFQSFDSELEKQIIPFAELEFGDTLCFERGTNKIGIYNHETDAFDVITDDWDTFIKELYDDHL